MNAKRKALPVIFQGLEAGLRMFRWVVVILLVLFCFSGVEKVRPGNVGLLLRFGKLQGATAASQIKQPGLLLALPYPIDKVIQVPVKEEGEVVIEEVYSELSEVPTTDAIDPVLEGYCLTGDQNIIQAKLVVKYKITDPIAFELWVDKTDRDAILHDVVLAALTRTVAGWDVDDVLNQQRPDPYIRGATQSLAETVQRRAQRRLDRLSEGGRFPGCGLEISAVEFREIHPPRHVLPEFRMVQEEVSAARTEMRRAELFAAQTIPSAEAQRDQMIQEAKVYESTVTGRALAEVEEFRKIYIEYKKAPELVWRRMHIETLEEILRKVGKRFFVSPETRVILPGEAQP